MSIRRNPVKRIHRDLAQYLDDERKATGASGVYITKKLAEEMRTLKEKKKKGRGDWIL